MTSRCFSIALVALVLSPIPVLTAQSSKPPLFTTPFAISMGSETNPGQLNGAKAESVLWITPSRTSFGRSSARSQWGFGYQPEFEIFPSAQTSNTWNHSLDFSYGHKFSRRSKLDFGHSFVRSSDPGRLFTDTIFVLPRNNFRENSSTLTFSHEVSPRTDLSFRFDNTFTRISLPNDTSATYLDQYGISGTTGISRRIGERQKLTLSYSLLKFSPYRFGTSVDAAAFVASIPTVRAGISRFALELATAISESSPSTAAMAGGNSSSSSSTTVSASGSSTGSSSGTPSASANTQVTASPSTGTSASIGTSISTPVGTTGVTSSVSAGVSPSATPTISTPAISTPSISSPGVTVPTVTVPSVTVATSAPLPPAPVAPVPVPSIAPPALPAPVPIANTVSSIPIAPTAPIIGVVTPLPQPNATCPPNTSCTTTPLTASTPALPIANTPSVPTPSDPSQVVKALSVATPAAQTTVDNTAAPAAPATAPASSPATSDNLATLGQPFHVVTGTYTYAQGRAFLFEFSGGVMHDQNVSYLFGTQLERRFDHVWFAGSLQRFLSFYGALPLQGGQPASNIRQLPNGVRAQSVFSTATLRVGGKLTRRMNLETSGALSRSTANFVEHNVRSLITRARLDYWLTDRLAVFATADRFFENRNELIASQFDRRRVFGGLEFQVASPERSRPQLAQK